MINELKWQSLTAVVNEVKSPNQFVRKRFFANEVTHDTEDIETHIVTKGREIAPFVRVNGEAIMVGGTTWSRQMVTPPNIRIKRPLKPSDLMFNRQPGTVIYPTGSDISRARSEFVSREMAVMADMLTNAEEYLCCMALRGAISYSVEDQEVYTITFPRSSSNNVTLSVFWNDATPANVTFHQDIRTLKRLLSDQVGLGITDAICGREAADQLYRLAEQNLITFDNRTLTTGTVDFTSMYNEDGVLFIGRIAGINFWDYSRTADLNGTSVDMIRSKYVEFLSSSPASGREMAFGAIADIKALQNRLYKNKRFSKAWEVEDPSAMMNLVASRPLPLTNRANAHISCKVISG